MDCHIAFEPDLRIDSREFIDSWNDTPQCRELAEARLIPQPPGGFPLDSELVHVRAALLMGARMSIARFEPKA